MFGLNLVKKYFNKRKSADLADMQKNDKTRMRHARVSCGRALPRSRILANKDGSIRTVIRRRPRHENMHRTERTQA